MRSNDNLELLDLERDIPTTPDDVAALRRAGLPGPVDLEAYIRFLERLGSPSPSQLRSRRGPRGDRPFEL
jgi:hypothetical protein